MDDAELNSLLRRFGAELQATVAAERRDRLEATLFDVHRRTSLAADIFYDELPELLRVLGAARPAADLGRAMKAPGMRPCYLSLWVLPHAYLFGRQQRLLDRGLGPPATVADERLEDLREVLEFFVAAASEYRRDGGLFPGESDGDGAILGAAAVAAALALAEPPEPRRWAAMRAAAAALTLLAFTFHGEQRDGTFGHGPYPGPDGTVVWFEEFNDLDNDFLPWAERPAPLPVGNVVLVYAAAAVEVRCNVFGALRVTPVELEDRVRLAGALTRRGGELVRLDSAQLEEIAALAAELQARLFTAMVGWEDSYRIGYGARLFGNHLKPFFDLAGVPDGAALVGERLDRAAERALPRFAPERPIPSFWAQLADADDGELYTLVRTAA